MKNSKLLFLIVIIVVFFDAAACFAQDTFYVATNGNDAGPGTEINPWKTFQKACNSATPGSTVYIKQGVYNEKTVVNVSGSSGSGFITFRNYGSDTVILDGTGKAGDQMILVEDKSYIRFYGMELRNNLNQSFGSGIWVKGGGSHIEIRKMVIHDMKRTGSGDCMAISIYGTGSISLSNIVIDSNLIYDCQPGHSEALTLNGNVDTFQVTNNIVHDVNNIGIDMIGGEGTAPNSSLDAVRNGICTGNTVYNAHSSYGGGYAAGIYIDGGRNIVVERNMSYSNDVGIEIGCENQGKVATGIIVRDNLVFNNDKRGIGIGGYDFPATGKVTATSVLNNTCFNNDTFGTDAGELTIEYTENCVFKNNIFYASSHNRLMTSIVGNSSGNIINNNIWYAPGGAATATVDFQGSVYTGFSAYKSSTGQDAQSVFGNPQFLSAFVADPDFHLQEGSPAVDAGDALFVPVPAETDFEGNERISGVRVDCGAYERNQISVPVPTLIEPAHGAVIESTPVFLRWNRADSGSSYHVQVASDSLFHTLLLNDTLSSDTAKMFMKTVNGEYYWRVRATHSGVTGLWSEVRSFTYVSANRWKIISVSKTVPDPRVSTLYPTAISSPFQFIPNMGYVAQDTLIPGRGYWLKFGSDQTENISGVEISSDTIDVSEGWNLVGSISNSVAVPLLITIPDLLLDSNFFGYDKGYFSSPVIEPGKGYWMKAKQAGKIILQ